jgi:hypothetical protein
MTPTGARKARAHHPRPGLAGGAAAAAGPTF